MTAPATIILAAGKGTRMNSDLPKVLHTVGGKPLVEHVLRTGTILNPSQQVVITGHGAAQVEDTINALGLPNVTFARQEQQLGTGHAVMQAAAALKNFSGDVAILMGDVPLLSPIQLSFLYQTHRDQGNAITVATAIMPDPTGLGRIIRDGKDNIQRIAEQKDATPEELKTTEINTGIYIVKAPLVFDLLQQVNTNNAQKEYYLTDIIPLGLTAGHKVDAIILSNDSRALLGINTPTQLMLNEALYQDLQRYNATEEGVKMLSPETVFFIGDVTFGKGVTLGPNITFAGNCTIADNVTIEGNCHLNHVVIGKGAIIKAFSHLERCRVDAEAEIGPFARLRTGSHIHAQAKVGNFVETKNVQLGKGSKASHLTYLGDATIGEGVNIGAGTITCNYNGAEKFKTVIEDHVFVGSNTALVAPVTLGKDATIGAGSTITKDVLPGSLTLTRADLKQIANYKRPTKKKG